MVCLGPATRLASFVQQLPKTYVGEFRLGVTSASDDVETDLEEVQAASIVDSEQLSSVLPEFLGEIAQIPPAFSAIKLQGQRAYQLARQGVELDIEPRNVFIHSLELVEFDYPNFKLKIECGSGTYIRSLGRDLGKRLNSGAVMTSLVRTAVGQFRIDDSVDPGDLTDTGLRDSVVPPAVLFDDSSRVRLNSTQIDALKNGHVFSTDELALESRPEFVPAFDADENLVAIMYPHKAGSFKPRLNFVHYYHSDC